jgi:predicted AlkP superfamily phosphohydrolase/phosphomutase
MTFPAEPVNGVMVSGMDAPSLGPRAVHPANLLERMAKTAPDYRIMSKAYLRAEHGDWEGVERELTTVMVARSRFVAELARPRDLDLLVVNLEATDGAQHFFWQHADPSHPRHDPHAPRTLADALPRVYQATDRELGLLLDAFEPDTVLVVSDHGGGPSNDWILFVNDWLAAEGFLTLRSSARATAVRRAYAGAMKRMSVPLKRRLRPVAGRFIERAKGLALYGDVDWRSSKAYGTVQGMVRLNVRGREPEGILSPEEVALEVSSLEERARAGRFPDGSHLFAAVAPGHSVYGEGSSLGPDLVVEPQQGTEVRGRNTSARPGFLVRLSDIGAYYPSGVHTPVGMVVAAGSGVREAGPMPESDIHQVAGAVLAVMGVPAPPLDAAPLAMVTSPAVESTTGSILPSAQQPSDSTALTEDEETTVLERLRGLGYVD